MKNILCAFLLAGTLAAQAQMAPNDLLRHIPADADQVIDINLGAITSKIDFTSVLNLMGSKSKNGKAMEMVQHLMTAGLDFHGHVILVPTNNPTGVGADSIKYVTVILPITDSAKFVASLREIAKESETTLHIVHLPGKERVATYKDNAVAWTNKLVVFTTFNLLSTTKRGPEQQAAARLKTARRAAAALTGFTTTKFISDEHLATAFADDGDVHIWSHKSSLMSLVNKFGKMAPGMNQLGMLSQMSGGNKGNNESIATVRFDNGNVSYSTLKYFSPAEIAATQRILGQGLNPQLLAIVPPRPLIGAVSLHFDMAALEDSIKKVPSMAMLDTMMQGKGVHIWDFFQTFKGDFMFLLCAPDKPATTDSVTGKKKMPSPTFYLVASVTDKAAFEKIVPTLKLKDALAAGADTATTDTAHSKNPFPYYLVQNDLVVVGKRQRVTEFFTPGAGAQPVGTLLPQDLTRVNTLTAVLDFHAFGSNLIEPTATPTADQPSKEKATLDALRNLQTLQISVGAIHGDAMETRIQLNFVDKTKNSLTVLMNLFSSLSQH
jgi:hypothetical protein